MSDGLIQGRACGACTVCCKDLTIQSPELSKLPGFLCTHCVEGRGCQIYDQRPSVCRAWYCAWRSIAALDETWRPDRSGVLIEYTQEAQKTGLKITLLRDEAETAWHALADLVSHLVAQDVPAFLVVPGPPGFTAGKALLNDAISAATAAGRSIIGELQRVRAACAAYSHTPLTGPAG